MQIHRIPHIINDMLSDPCIQIALQNADQVGSQRDGERQSDQHDKLIQISSDQSLIDDPACQN